MALQRGPIHRRIRGRRGGALMQNPASHEQALRPAAPWQQARLFADVQLHGNRKPVADVVSSPAITEMNPWLTTQIVTPELRPEPLTGKFLSLDQDGRLSLSQFWRLSFWSRSLPSTSARTIRPRSILSRPQPRLPIQHPLQQHPLRQHRPQPILPSILSRLLPQSPRKVARLLKTQHLKTELSRKGADLTSGRGALRPSAFLVLKARTC